MHDNINRYIITNNLERCKPLAMSPMLEGKMMTNWYVKSVSMAIPIVIFYITVTIVIMVHH
jgi:hypothetical protein